MDLEWDSWGAASLLLNSDTAPALLVISGKSYTPGQTLTSTPTTSTSLLLDLKLSLTAEQAREPPWQIIDDGPTTVYGTALPLAGSRGIIFGGDATGDASIVVQSNNDSAWFLSSTPTLAFIHSPPAALAQPARRQSVYSASLMNEGLSRCWVYGGTKADGSGQVLSELWEYAETPMGAAWTLVRPLDTSSVPLPMYGGTAVVVGSTIFFIGGVQVNTDVSTNLVDLSTVTVFTPSTTFGQGSWSTLRTTAPPRGRRDHIALSIGNGEIWIQGGRDAAGGQVLADGAILDTVTGAWRSTFAGGNAAWGQSAAMVGSVVVIVFGARASSFYTE